MQSSNLLENLIFRLQVLPGVGKKTAQRMAYSLLAQDHNGGLALAQAITQALERIRRCSCCRNYSEDEICPICASTRRREEKIICVVESPSDAEAIEQTGLYHGLYFVLHGRISPLDGIGPEELGLNLLEERFSSGDCREVILATNSTVEGNMTVCYIAEIAQKYGIRVSIPARGIPVGSELDNMDENTLTYSFVNRQDLRS